MVLRTLETVQGTLSKTHGGLVPSSLSRAGSLRATARKGVSFSPLSSQVNLERKGPITDPAEEEECLRLWLLLHAADCSSCFVRNPKPHRPPHPSALAGVLHLLPLVAWERTAETLCSINFGALRSSIQRVPRKTLRDKVKLRQGQRILSEPPTRTLSSLRPPSLASVLHLLADLVSPTLSHLSFPTCLIHIPNLIFPWTFIFVKDKKCRTPIEWQVGSEELGTNQR